MAPARIGKKISQAVLEFKTGLGRVFQDIIELFKGDDDRVMAGDGGYNTVFNGVVIAFFDKGAKHTVPDDEDTGIITIQIARIGAVMDAVMARRVENKFNPFWKFFNRLRVYPKLIDEVHCPDKNNEQGVKAQNHQRHGEQDEACDMVVPWLT